MIPIVMTQTERAEKAEYEINFIKERLGDAIKKQLKNIALPVRTVRK